MQNAEWSHYAAVQDRGVGSELRRAFRQRQRARALVNSEDDIKCDVDDHWETRTYSLCTSNLLNMFSFSCLVS